MNCKACQTLNNMHRVCWNCAQGKINFADARTVKLSQEQIDALTRQERTDYNNYLSTIGGISIACSDGETWMHRSKVSESIRSIIDKLSKNLYSRFTIDSMEAALLFMYTGKSAELPWIDPISSMYKFLGRFRLAKALQMVNYTRVLLDQVKFPGPYGNFFKLAKGQAGDELYVLTGAVEVIFTRGFAERSSEEYPQIINNIRDNTGHPVWSKFGSELAYQCLPKSLFF
nr:hypothetical protein K-LCC10_0325 [Kaumoebavirus]